MLSAQEFAELIAIIETTREDNQHSEVRRAQRIVHPCRITITLGTSEDEGPALLVQLKDISARGVSLLHNEELAHGTSFVVNLESPDGKHVSILSTVAHCRKVDEHTHQIGAEFTCVLGQPQGPAVEPSAEDLMRIRTSILR